MWHEMKCEQGWSEFWPGGFNHLVKTGLNHLIKPTKTGQKWSKLKFHWFSKKIEKNLVILWLFKVFIVVFGLLIFKLSDFFPVIVLLPIYISFMDINRLWFSLSGSLVWYLCPGTTLTWWTPVRTSGAATVWPGRARLQLCVWCAESWSVLRVTVVRLWSVVASVEDALLTPDSVVLVLVSSWGSENASSSSPTRSPKVPFYQLLILTSTGRLTGGSREETLCILMKRNMKNSTGLLWTSL